MSRARTLIAVTLPIVLLAACSGDDSQRSGSDSGGDDRQEDFSVVNGLDELPAPDGDGAVVISIGDVRAVSEAVGADRPGSVTDDGFDDWLLAVVGSEPDAEALLVPPWSVQSLSPVDYAEATGFFWGESDWFSSVSRPPDDFTVLHGDVAQSDFGADVTELDGDLWTLGDGEDHQPDPGGNTDADQLGRPVRMARSGERLAVSLSTPMVADWLAGEGDRLGDDDALHAVAEQLDDAGAVSAYLVSPGAGDEGAVGVGWLGDRRVAIVYDALDPDRAGDRVDDLKREFAEGTTPSTGRPFADLLTVTEATARGRTIVVTADLVGPPSVPIRLINSADLPRVD